MDDQIKRRGAALFLFFFGTVFFIAFFSLRLTDHGARPLVEDIYHSIGLFTGNSSWAFGESVRPRPPFVFRILAVLAPLISALGLVELVTGRAWSDWFRLKAWMMVRLGWVRPVVIFGLSKDSLIFARSLAGTGRDALPVIFDASPSIALANLCDQEGIAFFTLNSRQKGYFWRARHALWHFIPIFLLISALKYVSFLADPDEQVSLIQALDGWLLDGPALQPEGTPQRRLPPPRKDAWLLLTQRGLRQRLDSYLKFQQQTLHLQFFDLNSLAARQLLQKHPLDRWADVLGHSQIHLAIYGFGTLGRAIAKEAARYYVTRASIAGTDRKLRLTIIDKAPAEAKAAFLAEEPEIENILHIDTRNDTLQIGGFTREQLRCIVPEHVTAHIITLNEPEWVVAQALSLRRWLLEPPPECDLDWFNAHRNAPIFIPVADWHGLGSLIRSGVDGSGGEPRKLEVPDGIFGFGNTDELLDWASILEEQRIAGAKVLHEVYQNQIPPGSRARPAIIEWSQLAPNFRQSNMLAFDHIWVKARAAGYRIVPIPQAQSSPYPVAADERRFLSQLEHQRYLAERIADGWRRADTRCDPIRVHPDLCDWADLRKTEQEIDTTLIEAMSAALFAVKLHFLKAHFVGIIGHRLPDARDRDLPQTARPALQEAALRSSLNMALSRIVKENPGTVLLSALATGADSWAVEEAKKLGIPWIVVLPLPYELYSEDFSAAAKGDAQPDGSKAWEETFRALIAGAEYYFELPLTAGRCSEMGRRSKPNAARRRPRDEQYAMAGRFIVERSNTLLAVWDGNAARGHGGTGELLKLRVSQPETFSKFYAPVEMTFPQVYFPDGTRMTESELDERLQRPELN